MKRPGKIALFLVPLGLFAIACVKCYQAPFESWPFPALPDDDRFLRRPAQLLVALVGLFAPMPLCLSVSIGLRRRREHADEVGMLMTQLFLMVAVEVTVFFGLVALGAVTWPAFVATHGVLALAGALACRADARRPGGSPGSAPLAIRTYLLIALALVSCGLASVHFGKDISYDFYNYHYYNAYSFLNDRDRVDFAPADIVTHLNPLLDVAYYLLIQSLRPVWVGFVVGAAHGVAVVLTYGVAREVLGGTGVLRPVRVPLALACAIAGASEPVFLGQLGTTMHDNLLASFVLTALLLVLRVVGRGGGAWTGRAGTLVALAGASVGLATGFKLTAATYAVALAIVMLAAPIPWKRRLGLASWFGAGAATGFLLSNGYWMGYLYTNYQSPVFPLYNALFKSPYYTDSNISYLKNSADFRWFDHLLIPFYFAAKGKVVSETPSSDLRLAVAYVLLVVALLDRGVGLLRADWRSRPALRKILAGPLTPGAALLIVFAVVSYVVWYLQFRILRYLVAVKVLAPLVCVLLLLDLFRSRRRVWVASSIVLALVAFRFDAATWGRGNWKKRDFLSYSVPKIEAERGGIVLMNASTDGGGFLNAFAALTTKLPPAMRYVRIDAAEVMNPFGGKPLVMEQQVVGLMRDHAGPVFLLTHTDPAAVSYARKLIKKYDLVIAGGEPPKSITGWYADLGYWRLERTAVAASRADALRR